MCCDLNVGNFLVGSDVDYSDLAVGFASVFAAVPDIKKLAFGIVGDAIRAEVKMDGGEELQGVAAKDANHAVITAGDDEFFECGNVDDALRFFESRDTLQPFRRA